ncbi:MAG: OadG family protein [Clostridia bacterium]|nr:OadG family protein [Clostridia bacterium]
MNINGLMPVALAVRENGTYPPFSAEGMLYAAKMTLLGMGAVFGVLIILMLVVKIVGRFVAGEAIQAAKEAEKAEKQARRARKEAEKEAKRQEQDAAKENSEPAEQIVPEMPATPAPTADSDDALVAILAAAIAAYRAAENPDETSAGGFRVVSFRRAGGGRAWNANK